MGTFSEPTYFDEIQQWYVVFQKREKPRTRLIHWFVHSGIAHCLLVRPLSEDLTLVIDPCAWGVAVKVVERNCEDLLLEHAAGASAIVSYVADYRRVAGYIKRGPYTCVMLLKAILALKHPLVQTPFSLYRVLLRYKSATVVKPWVPYVGG